MRLLNFLFFVLLNYNSLAQPAILYSAAYGQKTNPAIIFLHGGPGYNSFSFEASTAERLAADGYYVIVYDQRGCGRSSAVTGLYTFDEALQDIDDLISKYEIVKPTLIGHSWGGTLGIMYAARHPEKIKALVLTGSPLSYQQTFRAIIGNCRQRYTATSSQQLQYIDMLEKMDTAQLLYANYCFMHAMSAGLYKASTPADNSKDITARVKAHKDIAYIAKMTEEPVSGFYNKEHYTQLDLRTKVKTLKTPLYAIYGDEDGLFNKACLQDVEAAVGEDNYTLVSNASHNVFIDQQDTFITVLKTYMAK